MLWTAVALLQRKYPDVVSVVYTGDVTATKEGIIEKVKVCSYSVSSSGRKLMRRKRLMRRKCAPSVLKKCESFPFLTGYAN